MTGAGVAQAQWLRPVQVPALNDIMPDVNQDLGWLYQREVIEGNLSADQVAEENRLLLQALLREPRNFAESDRRRSLGRSEADALTNALFNHPVVGALAAKKYDPERVFGFCFGRAEWVYIELLRQGFAKSSMRKIFAVGPMRGPGQGWGFHVATMVRAINGNWWVIDLGSARAESVEDWMSAVKRLSVDSRLKFYVTEPDRLGASTQGKFSARSYRGGYYSPAYQLYFTDMMASFKKAVRAQFPPARVACQRVHH